MGQFRTHKATFTSIFAAAILVFLTAPSESIAVEFTEIGPRQGVPITPPGLSGKGEGHWAKAGSTLRRVFAAHGAHQQAAAGAPFKPDNPSIRFRNGLILVDAVATSSEGAALLAELEALGLENGTAYRHLVSGYMPLGQLNTAVELGNLRAISASLKPQTNSAVDPVFGLVHDRRAAIAMGLIASEADPQTYTGAGIKVGVLSDTYNFNSNPDYDGDGLPGPVATNANDDLLNGDLPGGAASFVALHTPGNVDHDDRSVFAAVGTNGSNTTIDNTEFAINRDPPEPDGSMRFDPVSFIEDPITAFVSYPDDAQYDIGDRQFTVEGWFNFAAIGDGTEGPILASQFSNIGNQRGWWLLSGGQNELEPLNTNQLIFAATSDGTFGTVVVNRFPFAPVPNVWYHLAISRDDNNDLRAFVNGQQIGGTISFPLEIFDATVPLRISSFDVVGGGDRPFDGWIEDFRMVVGEAVYTSNFTPPTGPLDSELPSLPGPTTTVLEEGSVAGIDEGRAMMQLIHDVAPDASLSFHSAFNGIASFAQGIEDLAADGADVIVDDIIYFAEPMFQDGIVAQAVDNVVSQGVAYFSSAGNAAQNSYESPFVASGERLEVEILPGFPPEQRGMLHDFDPTAGVDWTQSVTLPVGTTFTLVAQWDQPFASNCGGCPGSSNDVDIYLIEPGGNIITSSISDNLSTGDPVEVLQYPNSGLFGTEFEIMIAHYDVVTQQNPQPGSPPTLMKYVWFGQSDITVNEYTTNSPASYGHANAAGAESVGAAFYLDTPAFLTSPPLLESFSSQGGVPILFDVNGAALGAPDLREKPEIVAPDGTNTTFFFRDTTLDDADEAPEVFPNFFGTSAAAPHAAAIAALMLEANPSLLPADIYNALESTAINMGPAGFDNDTGYGLVDANAAISQVTGGNLSPLAVDDSAATDQFTTVPIDVLFNDTLGNQPTTISNIIQPANGSAAVNDGGTPGDPSDDTIDYTPDGVYIGLDPFTYEITDSDLPTGETSTATVNVTVSEANVAPDAVDDPAVNTLEDTPLLIDVLFNDLSFGNLPSVLSAGAVSTNGGTVAVNDNGTPGDISDDKIDYVPAENYFGPDSFVYTITDNDSPTPQADDATVTITVQPVNDDPVADNDATSTNEDSPVVFDDALLLDGDTDIEGDPLSIIIVDLLSSQLGDVENHGDGTYTYTPPPNFNGSDAIDYTVSDNNGGTDTASIVVTVDPVNDAPDAATIANQNSQDGDTGISVDASTTDTENDTLSYIVVGQPAGLSINSATGEITGTVDANASAGGVGGVYTVVVTASDAGLSTDYQFTWTVSAGPVNGSPNPGNVSDQNSVDGESGISVSAATTDPEGDPISYSLSGQPAGLTINSNTGLITGTVANNASQGGAGGVYTVIVTADDTLSTPTQYQFSWTVTNPAPVAIADGATVAEDSGANAINVLANDNDPDGDTMTVSAVTQGTNGTVTNNGNNVSYAPNPNFWGGDSFTYTVSDGNGGSDTETVTVTVTAVNDAPAAVNISDQNNVDGDTGVSVDASTTDPDGDALTYSASGLPASLIIDTNTGLITDTIANNASQGGTGGVYAVTVTADDGTTTTDYGFSWTVTAPPSIVHVGGLSGSSAAAPQNRWDATVIITVHNAVGAAVANATVNGSWSNGTNGGATCDTNPSGQCSVSKQNLKGNVASVEFTVDNITGAGTYDPGANNPPGANVTVFKDGPPADLLPNAVNDSANVVEGSTDVPIAVLDNDSLGDAPTTITDVTDPPNGTADINIDGSAVDYTPDPTHLGADSFSYTITDADGDTSSATVSIDVVADTGPLVVHVGTLAGSSASAPKNRWDATVTIPVHDVSEGAISGATVNGTWSNGATGGASCVTEGTGQCAVTKNNLKGNVGSVTFTVNSITGTNMNYDSGDDHSPGSSIVVSQP